jgi:scyllo-inositol 2-dehydrogenase (NADP+)
MNKIKVGLIGFGLSGRVFHTSLLKACNQFEIKKVYSSRVNEIKETLPKTVIVNDIKSIIKDTDIDLVIICGPNMTHYDQCKMALLAGKHVVVEKPFVSNSIEGEELISLAKKQDLILTVFHNRRWDSDFLVIKKLISDNRLGNIKQFESHFDRWRPVKREGRWKENPGLGTGILFDLGSHLIDQCLCLFGKPDSLFADLADQKDNDGVVDYFHVILQYKEMRAVLHSSSFSLKNPRLNVLGDNGNFVKYGLDTQEAALITGADPREDGFGKERASDYGFLITKLDEEIVEEYIASPKGCYLEFYKQLANAIEKMNLELAPVNPESALDVIKIIEAAQVSSLKRKWVDL